MTWLARKTREVALGQSSEDVAGPDPCSRADPAQLGSTRPLLTLQCMEKVSRKEMLVRPGGPGKKDALTSGKKPSALRACDE